MLYQLPTHKQRVRFLIDGQPLHQTKWPYHRDEQKSNLSDVNGTLVFNQRIFSKSRLQCMAPAGTSSFLSRRLLLCPNASADETVQISDSNFVWSKRFLRMRCQGVSADGIVSKDLSPNHAPTAVRAPRAVVAPKS